MLSVNDILTKGILKVYFRGTCQFVRKNKIKDLTSMGAVF